MLTIQQSRSDRYLMFMCPRFVDAALGANVGVVAVSHVHVLRKTVESVCVLEPCVHQGKTVVTSCTNQTVGVTLKQIERFTNLNLRPFKTIMNYLPVYHDRSVQEKISYAIYSNAKLF